MSFGSSDLGDIGTLAEALGLIDSAGGFEPDWLTRPGDYLSAVIADADQREALIKFIDDALGGSQRQTDASGRIWLPIVEETSPDVTVYAVLDESPETHVRIGVGVKVKTTSPDSETQLFVPLFKAAKNDASGGDSGGDTAGDPLLLGKAGGVLGFSTDIVVDPTTPAPGTASLGRIGLSFEVPTAAGDGDPTVSLTLGRLQLPGSNQPRDLSLSLADAATLDDTVLDLVLGLIEAQAANLPATSLSALAGLLGLDATSAIPDLPVAKLASQGPKALADWFDEVMRTAASAWYGELAALLGAGATAASDGVAFTLGAAEIKLGVDVKPGTGGVSVVTPVLSARVADTSLRAEARAELARIDLGSGSATALPRLGLQIRAGKSNGSGTALIPAVPTDTAAPALDGLRLGVALDDTRRPVLVIAADGVRLNGKTYDTLDLSSPGAIADTAESLVDDALTTALNGLLTQLGGVGTVVKTLLGLEAPTGHPGVATVKLTDFLSNPLAAVGDYWKTLISVHASAVPVVLETLRELIADAAATAGISGTGTDTDPWRLPLVGQAALRFHKATGEDRLVVGLTCRYVVDSIGLRCTRVSTDITAGLADIDLNNRTAVFGGAVDLRLAARARGDTKARFSAGPFDLSADHVGLHARWRAGQGLTVDALAPNPTAAFDGYPIPVAMPSFDAAGKPTMDAAGWDDVERLIGILASQSGIPAFRDLAAMLGWIADSRNPADDPASSSRPRLRLADLAANPETALRTWAAALLLEHSEPLETALTTLARQLTGSAADMGRLVGGGRPELPYGIPLQAVGIGPELAMWLAPFGPTRPTVSDVDDAIRDWRPGDVGLDGPQLADALGVESLLDTGLSALAEGRTGLADGIEALTARWSGTDGRIAPPTVDPAGVTVHRLADVAWNGLADALDLNSVLGVTPDVTIHVAVVGADADLPWSSAPAGRVIDLRAAGLSPESFAAPTAAAGEWFVALGTRSAARLSAGDADGIAGQAARLQRVLPAFAGLGHVAVVAEAGAGHAARRAADAVSAVASLVTLGTPAGPVSFTVLDTAPGAEALRVLAALLPEVDAQEPDDIDLARGRALLKGLTDLLPEGDPGVELRPPATLPGTPRAGLAVHAVFGLVSRAEVRAALTAVTAAGLAARAVTRAAVREIGDQTGAGFGVRLPVTLGGGDLRVEGDAVIEALGFDLAAAGGPTVRTDALLRLNLAFRSSTGWLLGGPDPSRAPGPRPDHELRAIEASVTLPLSGSGAGSAEIALIEPRVFGIGRDRWVVSAAGASSALAETVTPALPEIRVLLSQFATRLAASTDPAIGAVRDLLEALGLLDAAGGFLADGLDHLLNEPARHVSDALADAARRTELQTALSAVTGALPGLSFDLAKRTLGLTLSGVPGTLGLAPWSLSLDVDGKGPPRLAFELEAGGSGPAGSLGFRCQTRPLKVELLRARPGASGEEALALWPNPDAADLLASIARLAPAEMARYGLEYLRELDDGARTVVEAAYDALGLLGSATSEGARVVRLPLELIENPAAWLGHAGALGGAGGLDAAKLAALLDAFKPILGVSGAPGEWQLASGIALRAETASGAPRLAMTLDTSGFTAVATAAGRLTLSGTVALALPAGLPPRPEIAVAVGLAGAAAGRRAVHVSTQGGLRVFVRPDAGADLSLYPDPPGLASLASAATQALPLILDELAKKTGTDLAGKAGAAVRAVGDAMALRDATSQKFQSAAIEAWANDPAAAFATRLTSLAAAEVSGLASALSPLLPAGVSVSGAGGQLTVTAGGVSVGLATTPFQVSVSASLTGVPGIERLDLATTLDSGGLDSLVVDLGPADIDAGGVSLRPYLSIAAGNAPAGGGRVDLGLGLDATGAKVVVGRWVASPAGFSLVAIDGAVSDTDPEAVALALVDAALQLVAGFAMQSTAVDNLLDTTLPGSSPKKLREALRGVFLEDVATPTNLDSGLFDLDQLLARLQRLLSNLADVGVSMKIDGDFEVGISKAANSVGLSLGLNQRYDLNPGSSVVLSLENDARWIKGTVASGLTIGLLDLSGATPAFAPSLSCDGIGLRVSRPGAPLIDAGVTLGSLALHLFGRLGPGEAAGGVQIQLGDLAVGVSGASGGNPVAQGIVADSASGPDRLAPRFSPALAVQKHGNGPVMVSLRAGEGDGPWWLVIQKGFGPIYVEQVGFDTTVLQDDLVDISLLLDGRVSIAGLTAAVDDLRLTYLVASNASVFDPAKWRVDLAGLAVEADLAGVTLAGGLRKFQSDNTTRYIGMLLGRFATYGLSVYGGYSKSDEDGNQFSSFFAFGAVNGPIGGPPAFFLTGIGGGVGINHDLIFPSRLDSFGEFPFIKALDPAATVSGDPMTELTKLSGLFPIKRGDFWFAAGLSFTSFALVDGIAVVSVKVGDGLEISLLGLARMALPRPQVPLVSIELGLLARMSTKEGVLWIQAELTENSWLLHESVRLTGGFAFVSWFDGPRAGEFVLTMGGYHPSFKRDGYPVVPRLGFNWRVKDAIVIKGENYFALTSEALMAGGHLEASARFGPAWAEVVFGANGIVYFDPFRFEVEVYARISAGVTIDVWIGEITISIRLGARIEVKGPRFHGKARFEVGPVKLTVAFGNPDLAEKTYIDWDDFVPKYLEDTGGGKARVLTAIPGKGSITPGAEDGGSEKGTADGSAQKPFEVLSEFEITVTTLVPTRTLKIGNKAGVNHNPSRDIGLAPMGKSSVDTTLELHLRADEDKTDEIGELVVHVRRADGFPVGVWGNPQPDKDRKVPKGEVIEAVEGVRLEAVADIIGSLPKEMSYHQVDAKPADRRPLPFEQMRVARAQMAAQAAALKALLPDAPTVAAVYDTARPWLAGAGRGGTALAALEQERPAPPRLGALASDLAETEPEPPGIALPPDVERPPVDTTIRPPVAVAVLTAEVVPEVTAPRTTVTDPGNVVRMAPPRLVDVEAGIDWAVPARLLRMGAAAGSDQDTLVARSAVPLTRGGHPGVAAVDRRGAAQAGKRRLTNLTRSLAGGGREAEAPATLATGEIGVFCLPNAQRDVDADAPRPKLMASGGPARVLALGSGGRVLADAPAGRAGVVLPRGTERVAVWCPGRRRDRQAAPGLLGWHANQSLAYVGWSTALVPGGLVSAPGAAPRAGRQQFRAGWVPASALTRNVPLIVTRLTAPGEEAIRSLAIVIDDLAAEKGEPDLSLGLEGAERATDAGGREVPPTVIVEGQRSFLVYALRARPASRRETLKVTVAAEEGWRLAGVVGSTEDAAALTRRLADTGLERALQPLTTGEPGRVRLRWVQPRRGPGTPRPVPPEAAVEAKTPRGKAKSGSGRSPAKKQSGAGKVTGRRRRK